MADARITQLAPLDASDAQPAVDVLAVADVSTTETKKITLASVVESGIGSIADGSIPGQKLAPGSVTSLEIADGSIGSVDLADNAVTTPKINDGAVTAAKIAANSITADQIAPDAIGSSEIADGSIDTAALQDSAVTTAKIASNAVTTDQIAYGAVGSAQIVDGSISADDLADGAVSTPKLEDGGVTTPKLAVAAVTNTNIGPGAVTGDKIATGTIPGSALAGDMDGSEFLPQVPHVVLAGPTSNPNARPTFRSLTSDDLPAIPAGNLPIASDTQLGIVQSGAGLAVSAGGVIRINNTVSSGTGTKVTYDSNGLIVSSTSLEEGDIPNLSADKIVSGQLPGDRLEDNSVTNKKLADYSISYIQEAQPPIVDITIGTLWYQESTSGLYMWNGNSFMPISIGRLSQENLRYCGIIDADTGLITGITTFGSSAGYVIGDNLGTATNDRQGVYFVISNPGSNIPETPSVPYDAGDWVLCNGEVEGWVRIDTLNGGGGGGAASLADLLDVTITNAVEGEILQYQASGQWTNVDSLSGGTY